MLSEGSIFSINITNRNGIPHSGQILNKINGNPNTPNFHKKGSWHYLDDDLIPNVRTIEIT